MVRGVDRADGEPGSGTLSPRIQNGGFDVESAVPSWVFGVRSVPGRLVLAVVPTLVLTVVLWSDDNAGDYRAGPLFVLPVLLAGVLAGWVASGVAGILSTVSFWYLVVPPHESFGLEDAPSAVSLLSMSMVAIGAAVVYRRLEQAARDIRMLDRQRSEAIARENLARAGAEEAARQNAAGLRFGAAVAGLDSRRAVAAGALAHLEVPATRWAAVVATVKPDGLDVLAHRGLDEHAVERLGSARVVRAGWFRELLAGRPMVVDDASKLEAASGPTELEQFTTGSWALFPVRGRADTAVLGVHAYDSSQPLSSLRSYFELCAEILASALQRAGEREALEATLRERDRIARTLSTTLLPPRLPRIKGFELDAWLEPASRNEVAGDFYDVFAPPSGGWLAVMGDVCGKGAEAAAVTSLARYATRVAALDDPDPQHVAQMVNTALLVDDSELFCTMAFIHYREDGTRGVRVALAGHPQPRMLSADGVLRLGTFGTPLGLFESDVTVMDHPFEPGDTIVMFTDGLIDCRPGLDEEGLDVTLASLRGTGATSVAAAVRAHVTTLQADRVDDTAVLTITRIDESG